MLASNRTSVARIAIAAGACLVVAALWHVLFQAHITAPAFTQGGDNQAYFAWWRPLEWQTIGTDLLAAAGFAGVASLGLGLGGAGGAGLAVGGVMASIAELAAMGGQHGVLLASLTTLDAGILGAIGFVSDSIATGLLIGAYAILGLGVLGLGLQRDSAMTDAVSRFAGVALAVGLVALAVFEITDPLDLIDPVTAIVGIVLAPAWLWRVSLLSALSSASGTVASGSVQGSGAAS